MRRIHTGHVGVFEFTRSAIATDGAACIGGEPGSVAVNQF